MGNSQPEPGGCRVLFSIRKHMPGSASGLGTGCNLGHRAWWSVSRATEPAVTAPRSDSHLIRPPHYLCRFNQQKIFVATIFMEFFFFQNDLHISQRAWNIL